MAVIKANGYGHGIVPWRKRSRTRTHSACARSRKDGAARSRHRQRNRVARRCVRSGAIGGRGRTILEIVVHSSSNSRCWSSRRQAAFHRVVEDRYRYESSGLPRKICGALRRLRACRSGRAPATDDALGRGRGAAALYTSADRPLRGLSGGMRTRAQHRQLGRPDPVARGARDWVRPGLMLYGISPSPSAALRISGCGQR